IMQDTVYPQCLNPTQMLPELEILGALTLVTLPFATADYGPKEANKDSTAIEDYSKISAIPGLGG
ncbi:MAG: hypothetical protein MJZ05_13605, partial [Fibrobacter sp.]|nr:hypothetical protein [Fibrobacter sp.]